MKRGWFLTVIASPVTVAFLTVVILAALAPPLSFIELRVLDGLLGLVPARPLDPRIQLVDLGDDPSVYDADRVCPQPPNGCEIPRMVYAKAARKLRHWGAKAVVFDLMFSRSCPFEDAELAKAFRAAGNVIVAATTKVKPIGTSLQPPVDPIGKAVWAVGSPGAHQPNETVGSVPMVVSDSDTGKAYLALALLGFQRFMGAKPSDVQLTEGGWLVGGGRRIPIVRGRRISLLPWGGAGSVAVPAEVESAAFHIDADGKVRVTTYVTAWNPVLIAWAGPPGTIPRRLMSDLLAMGDGEGRSVFGGTAVIIGRSAWDEHWTATGPMSGLEIQANALNTLLSGVFVQPVSPWTFLALLVVFAGASSWAVRHLRLPWAILVVAVLMLLALAVARELLVLQRTWMYLFYTDASILLSWTITTQVRQIDKVAGLVERLLPGFMKEAGTEDLGRIRQRDASLLYADIRNYTTISEHLRADEVLRLLGSYRSAVEEIVTRHGGAIAITPGDALLAVFWRKWNGVGHATCAVRAGMEILSSIPTLAVAWGKAGALLDVGVGVNSGPVAMGFLGKAKLEATVVGDAVNLAQRLESLTKDLDHPLLLSEDVQVRLEDDIAAVHLGEVSVRGRKAPTVVYGIGAHRTAGAGPSGEASHDTGVRS